MKYDAVRIFIHAAAHTANVATTISCSIKNSVDLDRLLFNRDPPLSGQTGVVSHQLSVVSVQWSVDADYVSFVSSVLSSQFSAISGHQSVDSDYVSFVSSVLSSQFSAISGHQSVDVDYVSFVSSVLSSQLSVLSYVVPLRGYRSKLPEPVETLIIPFSTLSNSSSSILITWTPSSGKNPDVGSVIISVSQNSSYSHPSY